ncbi:MAG: hypothetical protein LM557_02695 [Desulfurococcaceae archaeon]|nr:hypothetical protein [Desulfurococcaceae archaeon]MCC6052901.1 hypothetical protein [Desulfurococcaceae archaeon]
MSVVISVRIPKWLKKKLEEYGVDISDFIKRKLLEEAERLEEEKLARILKEIAQRVGDKVSVQDLAKIVDEERRER